ncbi:DUF6233 domain-containing protein [Streptomyces abyssomicinicus]|uniref:DUF6233 domain-containing protein n=1 Tax=Streptomyces abyssomicinicus TaxID=574929 RepID=UPI0013E054B4|nr:DUF6233 domain-containing protein [Streptomyces abyssomicinicus]
MTDPDAEPSRLALLRFLERVQERDLERTRRWIAQEERREAVTRERPAQGGRPAAQWLIEHGLSGRSPVYVHVGGCWSGGRRSHGVARDQALRALAEGVQPCPQCRPDTELGLLE